MRCVHPVFWVLFSTVREKLSLDRDAELATTSLRISLRCPVSTNAIRSEHGGDPVGRAPLVCIVHDVLPLMILLVYSVLFVTYDCH